MTRSCSFLTDAADAFDACFLDMFGTIWDGEGFYPDAPPLLETLQRLKKRAYILTNTVELGQNIAAKLARHGARAGEHYQGVISSGDVLRRRIREGYFARVAGREDYVFYGVGELIGWLAEAVGDHLTQDLDKADFAYISHRPTETLSLEAEEPILRALAAHGKIAVCANPDRLALRRGKPYCPQGALGKRYEEMGGKVLWTGKPYRELYDFVREHTGENPARCLTVGDTVHTDVLGGAQAGMKTMLVLKTGVTAYWAEHGHSWEALCQEQGVRPDFLIDTVR